MPEASVRKDIFGRYLNPGDKVAFCSPGRRELNTGEVKHHTPAGISVTYTVGSRKKNYFSASTNFVKYIPLVQEQIIAREIK